MQMEDNLNVSGFHRLTRFLGNFKKYQNSIFTSHSQLFIIPLYSECIPPLILTSLQQKILRMKEEISSLQTLPKSLIINILSYLSEKDLINCGLVSQRLEKVSSLNQLVLFPVNYLIHNSHTLFSGGKKQCFDFTNPPLVHLQCRNTQNKLLLALGKGNFSITSMIPRPFSLHAFL